MELVIQDGYIIGEKLGSGVFGVTYLAYKNGRMYTIKIPIRQINISNEEKILKLIKYECSNHYICLHQIIDEVIITDYVPGDPLSIYMFGRFPYNKLMKIYNDIMIALRTIHSLGVAHRDVKPANIIYDGENATLIDFGLATDLDLSNLGGTPNYIWPKINLLSKKTNKIPLRDNMISDYFALGVTLYVLVNSRFPLRSRSINYDTFIPSSDELINSLILNPESFMDF